MQPVSFEFAAKPAKAASRKVHDEDVTEQRQAISTFEVDREEAAQPKKAPKVIACQPNQLRAAPKPEADPIGKLEDRFETAARQEAASVDYGLVTAAKPVSAPTSSVSIQGKVKGSALDLAEEPTVDAYDDMPVEDFGMALLRGMGMTEENKVETVEYVARPSRMGLGVDPSKIGVFRAFAR
jgi:hypothetical protein